MFDFLTYFHHPEFLIHRIIGGYDISMIRNLIPIERRDKICVKIGFVHRSGLSRSGQAKCIHYLMYKFFLFNFLTGIFPIIQIILETFYLARLKWFNHRQADHATPGSFSIKLSNVIATHRFSFLSEEFLESSDLFFSHHDGR